MTSSPMDALRVNVAQKSNVSTGSPIHSHSEYHDANCLRCLLFSVLNLELIGVFFFSCNLPLISEL